MGIGSITQHEEKWCDFLQAPHFPKPPFSNKMKNEIHRFRGIQHERKWCDFLQAPHFPWLQTPFGASKQHEGKYLIFSNVN